MVFVKLRYFVNVKFINLIGDMSFFIVINNKLLLVVYVFSLKIFNLRV